MFDYNTPELTKVGSAAPSRRDPKAKLTVAVGSQNPVKVNSVKDAFVKNFPEAAEVEVYGYNVASGVPDQPWGEQETRQGALNRAENCLGAHCLAHGGSMPDFAVGLEGGVMDESLAQQHSGSAARRRKSTSPSRSGASPLLARQAATRRGWRLCKSSSSSSTSGGSWPRRARPRMLPRKSATPLAWPTSSSASPGWPTFRTRTK